MTPWAPVHPSAPFTTSDAQGNLIILTRAQGLRMVQKGTAKAKPPTVFTLLFPVRVELRVNPGQASTAQWLSIDL